MAKAKEPTGPELVKAMAEHPTLDEYFDRDPKTLTDEDLRRIIQVERQRREAFITKGEK